MAEKGTKIIFTEGATRPNLQAILLTLSEESERTMGATMVNDAFQVERKDGGGPTVLSPELKAQIAKMNGVAKVE